MSVLHRLFILLIILSISACIQTTPVTQSGQVYFKVLANGSDSGMSLQRMFIIDNQKDWDSLWRNHAKPHHSLQPVINFKDNNVIALFMGQKHTGGYAIAIDHIKQTNDQLIVAVRFTKPSKDAARSMALTQPYFFAVIDKQNKAVIFTLVNSQRNKKINK